MKKIFYKNLLDDKWEMTPNEKIVYSFIVSKSLKTLDCLYNSDGTTLDREMLDSLFEYYKSEDNAPLDIDKSLSLRKLEKELNITKKSIISIKEHLAVKGYINTLDNTIIVSKSLFNGGYFEIAECSLKGIELIAYSYLRNKSKRYGGVIDTWIYKIAQGLNITENYAKYLIHQLKTKGLVYRDNSDKLVICQ